MLDCLLWADCSNKVSDLGCRPVNHSLRIKKKASHAPSFVSSCATTKAQLRSPCQTPHPVEILTNVCSQLKKKKKNKKKKRKNQRQNNGLNMMLLSSKVSIYVDISYREKMVTWKSLNRSLMLVSLIICEA